MGVTDMTHAIVYVVVEDSARKPVGGASVTLRSAPRKAAISLAEESPGTYSAKSIEPGTYTLEVSRQGFLKESYSITLNEGRNSTLVVLGKRGEPWFSAGGRKIYFERVAGEFLIAARGENAAQITDDVLKRLQLSSARASGREAESQVRDSSFVRVSTPGAKTLNAKTLSNVTADLEKSGLKVRPAVIIKRGDGPVQGLTNELIVKFADGVSEQEVSRIANEHGMKVKRRAGDAYVLTSSKPPSYNLLDDARRLSERNEVVFAEPELLMEVEKDQYVPNDPLFNLLTHLPLINCDHAWEILGEWDPNLRGGSTEVCIAVFDPDGVTPDHPDLTANLTDGTSKLQTTFNFRNMTAQTVANLGGDHGTQCAGTATAAFDNDVGTAGVAPNCRLIGARIPSPATGVEMADAFLWAAGIDNGNTDPDFPAFPAQPADVISNSWGASNAALSAALQSAFDRLTDEGRETLGCVVTFSTGNLGYMQFSNIRRFAAYVRNVAVGASINSNPTTPINSDQPDPNGNTNNIPVVVDTRTMYNPFGPEMDIVAPSHTCYSGGALVDPTTSTVRVGNGAIDGCPGAPVCDDYDTSFGGTSHASPTIAGTSALVLSANPLLAWDEVKEVLQRTAVKIDFGNADAIGQYVDNDGDGLPEFSQWYGAGRVDVAAAAEEALLLYVAQLNLLNSITTP
jgi:subtilisin family serine protease